LKARKVTLDLRRIPPGAPLVGAALQHLEQLAGPQPLTDARVRAHLKVPGPRDRARKSDALERRLERLGVAVLDRYCREAHGMAWQGVARFVEVGTRGTVVPTKRQLEHAHANLLELERALGYEHPEPRVRERRPRLRQAEARWAAARERVKVTIESGRDPSAAHAELCRAQAELSSQAPAGGALPPDDLRALAVALDPPKNPVRSYKLSPAELKRRYPPG
jgi:hypothetical protein